MQMKTKASTGSILFRWGFFSVTHLSIFHRFNSGKVVDPGTRRKKEDNQ